MKVKNIMFFGAAAVILSAAGANAAFIPRSTTASTDTKNIVTSKYYVDSGLDAKQNVQIAEAADAGKAVVVDNEGKINISGAALGTAAFVDSSDFAGALTETGSATQPVYVNASGDVTAVSHTLGQNVPVPTASDAGKFLQADGTWATPENTTYGTLDSGTIATGTETTGKLISAKVLKDELDTKQDDLTETGSATQPVYVNASGDVTAVSHTLGQNVPVPTASDAGKFLQADGTWATPENTTYGTLDSGTIATGTETTGKLISAKVLKDELDTKQGLLGGGTSGTVLTNSGVAGTVNATVVSSSIDTSVNTDDNNIPTVGAVEGLVSSATNGNVIPERTGDCALNSGKNCALVAEADGLQWRVMAGN